MTTQCESTQSKGGGHLCILRTVKDLTSYPCVICDMLCSMATLLMMDIADVFAIGGPMVVGTQVGMKVIGQR